jgi:hypothetical protein
MTSSNGSENGVDPNIGHTPGGMDTLPYHSPAYPSSGEALNEATAKGSLAVFNMLLEYGAKIEDCSALHRAAGSPKMDAQRIAIIGRIPEVGVHINVWDVLEAHHGDAMPLHHAIRADRMLKQSSFSFEMEPKSTNRTTRVRGMS